MREFFLQAHARLIRLSRDTVLCGRGGVGSRRREWWREGEIEWEGQRETERKQQNKSSPTIKGVKIPTTFSPLYTHGCLVPNRTSAELSSGCGGARAGSPLCRMDSLIRTRLRRRIHLFLFIFLHLWTAQAGKVSSWPLQLNNERCPAGCGSHQKWEKVSLKVPTGPKMIHCPTLNILCLFDHTCISKLASGKAPNFSLKSFIVH